MELGGRTTREGEVFKRLLDKLDAMREALGGQVFDVLGSGRIFRERSLRDLLIDAVRYGERPDVRARLDQVVEEVFEEELREALSERALVTDALSPSDVEEIREQMERAEARKLQPHFIRSFFLEAFKHFGGRISEREPGRYEITHVPADIRARDRHFGSAPLLRRYERVTFEKSLMTPAGQAFAELLAPGHPLLDATVALLLERYQDLLKRGAILVAEADPSEQARALVYLEHAIEDGRADRSGARRIVSKQLQFVEVEPSGTAHAAGYAPYLDYRPIEPDERSLVESVLDEEWLSTKIEKQGHDYAISTVAPEHLAEVRRRTVTRVERTSAAVKDRLTKEITYWDQRANELETQERDGKQPKLNSAKARERADELENRLSRRLEELDQEKELAPLPPVVIGGGTCDPCWHACTAQGDEAAGAYGIRP